MCIYIYIYTHITIYYVCCIYIYITIYIYIYIMRIYLYICTYKCAVLCFDTVHTLDWPLEISMRGGRGSSRIQLLQQVSESNLECQTSLVCT